MPDIMKVVSSEIGKGIAEGFIPFDTNVSVCGDRIIIGDSLVIKPNPKNPELILCNRTENPLRPQIMKIIKEVIGRNTTNN